jgi:hypothetical protein
MNNEYFQRNTNVARLNNASNDNNTSDEQSQSVINEAILENATSPKRVQGDAGSVEQHSLQDLIAVERFLQSKRATQSRGLCIRLVKIASDGTT